MLSNKKFLLILSLGVVLLTGYLTIVINSSNAKSTPRSELEQAINQAQYFYNQKKQRGEDMLNGPCLSNALMPGWILDTAHNPRLPLDDLPENQCASFIEGRAQHFVELDLDGNLIRAK